MVETLPDLFILIGIAAVCGAIGKVIGGGIRGGLLASVAIGFVGALLGPWIAYHLNLTEPVLIPIGGPSPTLLSSMISSGAFVTLVHLLPRPAALSELWRKPV